MIPQNLPAFLHQTDLFRPYNDPDDHWDLLGAFALARGGLASLAGVLIDHPPAPPILPRPCDPDIGAVAQLSYLTGVHVPVAIGHGELFSERQSLDGPVPDGVRFILDQLRAHEALAIGIVGSARDVADAISREPELFRARCRAIYLSAGNGSPHPAPERLLEWNVGLDPAAFARVLQAPCPVYWMPCLDDEERVADPVSREYATHYQFRQGEILDQLPEAYRNYFGQMFAQEDSSRWLQGLGANRFDDVLALESEKFRMMYSTPYLLHLARLGVSRTGDVLPLDTPGADWVYAFQPIELKCAPEGQVHWWPATGVSGSCSIFRVLDTQAYPSAMTRAMANLLLGALAH